ncbi:MAG: terminase small subunit [Alphaproteobacteria bacterium]
MNKRILTSRQERFVSEYLIDLNASAAATRAGYSPKTAHSSGPRLLDNIAVANAIAAAKQVRSEETKIDADWVLRNAVMVFQRCVQEVRPVLHPKSRKQLTDDDGNAMFTFNAAAANASLALIGKHIDVGAFADRVVVSVGIAERLMAGRERVRKLNKAAPAP